GYSCPWGVQQTLEGSPGSTGGGSIGAVGKPTPRVVYVDDVVDGPDGPCLRRRAIPLPDDSPFTPGTDFGNETGPIGSNYPRCPSDPGGPGTPVIDARTVAMQGWEQVDLPKPQPYIAPGWAITGKPAYLETRGRLHQVFTRSTPIGPLEIDSGATYSVDWGDGETTGPYSVEGAPWPDGQITHTYINVGTYDVSVTETWGATWRLGPVSGQLGGQQTTGTLNDFRVEQIQAVVGAG
ncbi:MAG: hypothetical protein V7605_1929, partial [Acidimicrobiaceae bacterium]